MTIPHDHPILLNLTDTTCAPIGPHAFRQQDLNDAVTTFSKKRLAPNPIVDKISERYYFLGGRNGHAPTGRASAA